LETSASAKKERPYHHGDLRRALIEAALDLIASEGPRAISLREVARRAGVTHAAPYRHFPSREALLAAVAEEGFHALRGAMLDRMQDADSDSLARLQASGIAYVRFAVDHPSHFRVMFGAELVGQDSYPKLTEAGRAAYAVLVEAIEACQKAGVVREAASAELSLSAWALVHGLAMLLVDGQLRDAVPDSQAAEELARLTTSALQVGLRA
jgi:AcrR family transcriptional regulator